MASFSSRARRQNGGTIEAEKEILLDGTHELGVDFEKRDKELSSSRRRRWILAIGCSVILLCGLAVAFYVVSKEVGDNGGDDNDKEPYVFKSAAVAADTQLCSTVGRSILEKGGNAVDAAISTLLCGGLGSPQSMGIGGGFFMTIYNRATGISTIIDARETAPGRATKDMFEANPEQSSEGPLSIGVPGEIRGYWLAHQKFGSLSWQELFDPVVKLAAEGFPVPIGLDHAIEDDKDFLSTDPLFSSVFMNKKTGKLYREGEIMKRPRLAATLRIIAEEGSEAFYNGSLTDSILGDLNDVGAIISRGDLLNYTVQERKPIETVLVDGQRVISPPAPSGGPVLSFILNILDGYYMNPAYMTSDEVRTLTYHRVVEAFKFAYAKRTGLGDEAFVNVTELVKNLTSRAYADEIRSHITDDRTHNVSYYDPTFYDKVTTSTSHLSLIDKDGSAVSVTSTVNGRFGSHVMGSRTGIIFNNEMDDFSSPNITNIWGVPPSKANFIVAGKRPLSSMCPAIIVDEKNRVMGVYGAAGGSMITSATAYVIAHAKWLGYNIREAVEQPRLHHQLLPPYILYEASFDDQAVLQGLKAKGHKEMPFDIGRSIVQAIKSCDGRVCAYSDPRKGGIPDGF